MNIYMGACVCVYALCVCSIVISIFIRVNLYAHKCLTLAMLYAIRKLYGTIDCAYTLLMLLPYWWPWSYFLLSLSSLFALMVVSVDPECYTSLFFVVVFAFFYTSMSNECVSLCFNECTARSCDCLMFPSIQPIVGSYDFYSIKWIARIRRQMRFWFLFLFSFNILIIFKYNCWCLQRSCFLLKNHAAFE